MEGSNTRIVAKWVFFFSRNDDCVEGGESVLLDILPVVEDMRRKFPQHFTTLTRVPATFERIHINRCAWLCY